MNFRIDLHKLYVISLVFVVFFQAVIAHVGVQYSRYFVSYFSFLLMLIYCISRLKSKSFSLVEMFTLISISLISGLYVILSTYNYDLFSGLAVIKTFFLGVFLFVFLKLMSDSVLYRKSYHKFYLRMLMFISSYTILEFFTRNLYPNIYSNLVSFVSLTKVGGLNYLPYGGGFGVQPLGIFFDMHTHTSIFVLTALLSYVENKKLLFMVSIIALVVAFRATSFAAILLSFPALILPLPIYIFSLVLIVPIVYYLAETLPGQSWSVLKEHVFTKFDAIFERDLISIIFGTGYNRLGFESAVGYNELFVVLFIFSFGIVGLLLLGIFFLYLLSVMKRCEYRYDRLAIAMIVTIPIILFSLPV